LIHTGTIEQRQPRSKVAPIVAALAEVNNDGR
jgi:hypothetical protein